LVCQSGLVASALYLFAGALVASETEGWFPFNPENSKEGGSIGMAHWNHAPAGKHGFMQMDGDRLVFEDGTAVKLWGSNHGNLRVAPSKEEAEKRADWDAKYGINAMRLHKFTWPPQMNGIGDPEFSTRMRPELLDRKDYYMKQLRDRGIYYVWSRIFGHKPAPGDRDRLLAHDEIVRKDSDHFLSDSTYGVVNLFEDMQDLSIELTVELLNHRNPYTGLRYADDPALAYIELQNEDSAWWTAAFALEKMPTCKALFCELFSDWLRSKFGTHEALVQAWGEEGIGLWPDLQSGEHLDKSNLYPPPSRVYCDSAAFAQTASPQRLLDSARFLHERQQAFYDRFVEAIRATGSGKSRLLDSGAFAFDTGEDQVIYYEIVLGD